jgi:hypothetical protein
VSSYTITITPDDNSSASATLRVNLGHNGARIMELTVRAGDGEGFAPEELPGFDLSRLIGAIAPGAGTAPVLEAAGSLPAAPAVPPASPARPAKKAARRRSTRGAGEAGAGPARKAAEPAGRARKASTRKAAARKAAPERESRAYRRMPEDIIEVFGQAGGATALANHYGVPRHTAQGWLRRLRQQGDLPS